MYLLRCVPAGIVKDSQFPSRYDEEIDFETKTDDHTLVISGNDHKIRKIGAKIKKDLEPE